MKPFYQDSGVEKKLTEEKWHKFDSDLYLPSGWLQYMSYSRLFSSHTLNNAYQTTCSWKTREQYSSWDQKLFAA